MFELGSVVWGITVSTKRVKRQCAACTGRGVNTTFGDDNSSRITGCFECNGTGFTYKPEEMFTACYIHYPLTLEQCDTNSVMMDGKTTSTRRYMAKETGIGSGSVWHEYRLFATEDELTKFVAKNEYTVIGREVYSDSM